MKVSELIRILKKNHCKLLRHGNSHDIWISQITGKRFIVPRHPSQEIPTGTLKKIKEDAGIQ